jgi:hypothetical protein
MLDARSTHPPRTAHRSRRSARPPFLTQRRKDAKTQSPPTRPRTQRRRDAEGPRRILLCGEFPWPSSDGHGTTGPGNRLESELSCRFPGPVACALEERRPRHFSSSFKWWVRHVFLPTHRKERQNRRATGTSAGEKTGGDEHSRSEQTGFSPAAGDLQIACRSAVNERDHFQPQRPPLCVFAPLRGGWTGGLCVLCGSSGWASPASPSSGYAGTSGSALSA